MIETAISSVAWESPLALLYLTLLDDYANVGMSAG